MTRCRQRDKHLLTNWVSTQHHHQADQEDQQSVEQEEEPAAAVEEDVCLQDGQEDDPAVALEDEILSQAAGGPMTRSRTRARNRNNL